MSEKKETPRDLDRIFNARSIAVVGASNDPEKLGYITLASILRGGYEGSLYPINPKADQILGLKAYSSVKEVPGDLDLVVIVVPASSVPQVLYQAAERGAMGAIILSAGFRESGRSDLEAEILSISKKRGIRLLGPNIQGLNYIPNKLCAMFWPVVTVSGPIGIISQSGTITAALSEWAADEGLGISAAVNLGNQVDLCETDIIRFLDQDEQTRAIALYLEGMKEGRPFLETVKRVVRNKPVAILKAGQTSAGGRAAASHTGSLAGSYEIFRGACHQFGLVCVEDLETLYDSAKALATMRRPRGNRTLMISTSGGAGVLAVEEAERIGLTVPNLPEEFVERLRGLDLPPNASLSNPLDLASLNPLHFREVVLIADSLNVADIYLVTFGDPVPGAFDVVEYLVNHVTASLAVTFLGGGEVEKSERIRMHRAGISVFPSPERAIRGISAVAWDAQNRRSHGRG